MLTLKVSREKEVQMLVLKPGTAHFELLPGKLHLLESFIATGIDHILTGPDHLLFLLTIVVGAASWRYWLSAVSAFTVAHSITLTLSALGYVHIPSSIIEPGIAASIVLMALDNLLRPVPAGQSACCSSSSAGCCMGWALRPRSPIWGSTQPTGC